MNMFKRNMRGRGAFFHAKGFTGSLTLSKGLISIADDAFFNCSGFTGDLTIPNSVTSIGDSAFLNVTSNGK